MKETLADIAYAIDKHTNIEQRNMPCQGGVARYYVDLEEIPSIHQVFLANLPVRKRVWYGDDSINVYKNTKLGGALIMKGIGNGEVILAKPVLLVAIIDEVLAPFAHSSVV